MNTRARVTVLPAVLVGGFLASVPALGSVAAFTGRRAATIGSNDAGLPELRLVQGKTSITGMPESLDAGRYLVAVEGDANGDDMLIGAMFVRVPDDMTLDDAMAEAAKAGDEPPAFFHHAVITSGGAALVPAGQTSVMSVVDLPAGNWMLLDSMMSRAPMPFTVTGEMPADLAEPESSATITLNEMTIDVTEGALVAGDNAIRVDNIGAQPHFVDFLKVPAGTTRENVEAAIQAEMGATPEAEPLDFTTAEPAGYIGSQSTGMTVWTTLSLGAGTYAMMCWVTDPETGIPHAMSGMHQIVVVEG